MEKKNKKKKHFRSDINQLNLSTDFSSSDEQVYSNTQGSIYLKVQLSKHIKENFTWIKSNYKNIVLLHPSVALTFNSSKYLFIKGEEHFSLCVIYPHQGIKKSTIVFPVDNLGFQHNELVILQPYDKNLYEATEITVITKSPCVTPDSIIGKLSRQFICSDMKFSLPFSDSDYDFHILLITGKEIDRGHSSNLAIALSNSSVFSSSSNISVNVPKSASSSLAIENASTNFEKISRQMDSLSISESKIEKMIDLPSVKNEAIPEFQPDLEAPQYFITSYQTSIIISNCASDKQLNSPLIPDFSGIGGLKEQLHFIKSFASLIFSSNEPTIGVLEFVGPSGTGKTLTLKSIANEYSVNVHNIPWYNLYSRTVSDAEKELKLIFQNLRSSSPKIVLIDKFNYFCPLQKNSQNRLIHNVLSEEIKNCGKRTLFVVEADSTDYDDTIFKEQNALIEVVEFTLPSMSDRKEILEKLLAGQPHTLSRNDIEQCASHSQGFSGRDLSDTFDDALLLSSIKDETNFFMGDYAPILTFNNIKDALNLRKPTIIATDIHIKKVHWNDIGGMDFVKEKLKEAVDWPLKFPKQFEHFNITPPRGVILYGPPGCSKTMIAKALATECNFNFISKNASDFFNKYVGESEKAVHNVFVQARAKSPCIIFLDEIDALVAERESDSGGSGVGDQIITTLLYEIDGLEELDGVIILAATNRPDMLDNALMRKGRFDYFIYVPLPDIIAREQILKLQMINRSVANDLDLKNLALKLEGYTGAEIVNICNEAALQLLMEDQTCRTPIFEKKHFEKAMQAILPRITAEAIEFYEEFRLRHSKK